MRIIRILAAVITMASILILPVYAENETALAGYDINEDSISIYISDSERNIECAVSGTKADIGYVGNVFDDSEMYKTLFLIDTSASMKNYSESIKEIILACIDEKQTNEYVSIAEFGATLKPSYLSDYTSDRYQLMKAMDNIVYDDKASYIYDNLNSSLGDIRKSNETCYKRIFVFTDGCENSAKGITIDDVIGSIRTSGIQIYTVTFVNKDKSNYEQLKTVSRLSREGFGTDLRFGNGEKNDNVIAAITSSVRDISEFELKIPAEFTDGSTKAVRIQSSSGTISFDLRMPMIVSEPIQTEETAASEQEVTEISVIKPVETEAVVNDNEKVSNPLITVIIIVSVLVFILAIVVLIINIINSKPESKRKENGKTEPVSKGGGATIIINGDKPTDILDPKGKMTNILLTPVSRTLILKDEKSSNVREATVEKEVIIGRSSELANVIIDYDESVHRRHCRVFLKDGELYVSDLGGANKTYLNGHEVSGEGEKIKTSDVLKLGRVVLKITVK